MGREKALGIVDHDGAARIGKGAAVTRREAARRLRHRRLDLDGFDALDVEALQQRVRGEPGADADHRRGSRLGLERERQRGGQHHGDLVGAAFAVALQVDRAVGLAVGAQAGRLGILDEVHGGGLTVLLEKHRRFARSGEIAIAIDARGHLVRVKLNAQRDGDEQRR